MNTKVKNDTVILTVSVKNTSKIPGDEVVQIYVKSPDDLPNRPIKALKGFNRINLKGNEMKQVEFIIPFAEIEYWNTDLGEFTFGSGKYVFMAGASSEDIRLTGIIELIR